MAKKGIYNDNGTMFSSNNSSKKKKSKERVSKNDIASSIKVILWIILALIISFYVFVIALGQALPRGD